MLHELLKIWFSWVENWGYTGVFLLMAMESSIIPVPSEVVIPPAAFWAAQGKMDFTGVILAGTLGSYFGSAISYWVSQWVGLPILRRYGKYFLLPEDKLELAENWVKRFGVTGIFLARLLPVVRHLISIPAGILKMPYWRFSAATTVGAGLWCWVLAIFGREVIGGNPELIQSPDAMVAVLKAKLHWFVLAVVALGILYGVILWFKNQGKAQVKAGKVLAILCTFLAGLGGATLPLSGCASAEKNISTPRPVILISIDGLKPEDYLSEKTPATNLRALAQAGSFAQAAMPVYPSVTFPNHASIATGVRPATHGVVSNTIFDPLKGPTRDWYFDSKLLKAPTLWDAARSNGLKTAVIAWPVSLNARVDWLVPEVFSPLGIDHEANWKYTLKHTDPALMKELLARATVKRITSNEDYDQWMTDAAITVINNHHPSLVMIHYRSLDAAKHEFGDESPQGAATLKFVDQQIARLATAAQVPDSILLVTGDHGFVNVRNEIRMNALFRSKGWLKANGKSITSWKVVAHSNGGQAVIYVHPSAAQDVKFLSELDQVLHHSAANRYQIISRAELSRLGTLPDAAYALDPIENNGFSGSPDGNFVTQLKSTKGEHGALHENPKLWTGFFATGGEILPGNRLGKINIIDVAPTAAKLLHISMPRAEGAPLNLTR